MTDKNTQPETVTPEEESVMKFPMDFPVKVMGLTSEDFVAQICQVVHKHYPTFDESLNQVDYSKTKKYTSLTVTVTANSKEELDALYLELTKHPLVKVAL